MVRTLYLSTLVLVGLIVPEKSLYCSSQTLKTTCVAAGCLTGCYVASRAYCSYMYYWAQSRFADQLFLTRNRLFLSPESFSHELKASILKTHDKLNQSFWSKREDRLRNYPLVACQIDLDRAIDTLSFGFWLYPSHVDREHVLELITQLRAIRETIVGDNDFYKERRSLEKLEIRLSQR